MNSPQKLVNKITFSFFEIFRSTSVSSDQEKRLFIHLDLQDSIISFGLIDWQVSGFSPDLPSNDVR